jgi:hypothetical protein
MCDERGGGRGGGGGGYFDMRGLEVGTGDDGKSLIVEDDWANEGD